MDHETVQILKGYLFLVSDCLAKTFTQQWFIVRLNTEMDFRTKLLSIMYQLQKLAENDNQ